MIRELPPGRRLYAEVYYLYGFIVPLCRNYFTLNLINRRRTGYRVLHKTIGT